MTQPDTRKPGLLTPEQIAASRDRLLTEGFLPDSMAVRVHEQLLAAMQANRVNVEGACASMEDLKAECERLRELAQKVCRCNCFHMLDDEAAELLACSAAGREAA